jgi:membrane fusion protein (multidrug efflux system)
MADDHSPPQGQSQRAAPPPAAAAPPAVDQAQRSRTRGKLFGLLGLGVVVVGAAYGLYWFLVASHYESTDDAYVGADVAQVTPLVSGAVKVVKVADTQHVNAGDVLVEIDPSDAQLVAAKAEASFGSSLRKVRQDFATGDAMTAMVAARDADLISAKADLAAAQSDSEKAKIDLDRREALSQSGAVSGEELTAARNAYRAAEAKVQSVRARGVQAEANRRTAEAQRLAQHALIEGAPVESNPEVLAAKAALDTAKLDLTRTTIRAPISGVVARRQVQVGQRVQPGVSLMTVVPVDQVYVDANFKESQLEKVKVGQPVTLKADLYGGSTTYHGTVEGIGGGTGSAFAVIPAQNATGNWIKVVQRLPVRVRLDPQELKEHPLRVGLSMNVKIDVTHAGKAN